MGDFSSAESFKSGGIQYVFPTFEAERTEEKIHPSAAGNLLRVSSNNLPISVHTRRNKISLAERENEKMESIWMDGVSLPGFPALQGDVTTDVLVIGGGMAGLLCAYALQRAGVSCVVAEADTILSGATKNTTAKITAQHGLIYKTLLNKLGKEKARMYFQANQQAVEEYARLCQTISCDFSRRDNVIFSRTDLDALEAELDAMNALGIPGTFSQTPELPFPTVGAVLLAGQAQFHPLKFIGSIAGNLTIYERTPIRELKNGAAFTDHGRIRAETIVVATHFPFLNKHGSYFLKLYQQRSYALSLEHAPVLEGMYLEERENGLSFRSQNDSLILGGGGHRTGKAGGNWQALETVVRQYYPHAEITHRWAAQDCMTLDGVPYIGRYSARTENLYVATGFNKWGMTGSMAAAQVLTDLITGKGSEFETLFSPSRSMLHPQLGINALEAARNLLTFSTPRCPHMGCALKWNPVEHSWDCPCHGSRFTQDGKLIDNPATGDLKRRA